MPSNSILNCNNTLFQSTRASPYTYEPNSPPTIATLQGIRSTPTSSTLIKNNSINYGHNHTHTGIGNVNSSNSIGNGGPISLQSSINFSTTLNGHSSTGTLMNGTIPNGSIFRNSKNRFISKSSGNNHPHHPHHHHHRTTSNGTLLNSIVTTNNINSQPIAAAAAAASSSSAIYHIPPPSSSVTIAGPNHINSTYTTSINQANNSSSTLISANKQQQPLLDLSRITNPSASLAVLAHRTGSGTSSSGFAPLAQTSTPSRSTGGGSGGVGGGSGSGDGGSGGSGGGGGSGPNCGYGINVSSGLHRVPRSGSNSDCDVISSSVGHFFRLGVHGMLASLALMCLLSLMMAFLALFFLQKTGPIITIPDDLKSTSDLESFLPSSSSSGPQSSPLSSLPLNSKSKDFSSSLISSSSSSSSLPSSSSSSNHKHHHHSVNVLSQSRIVVNSREYMRVFQVSVGLSTLTIALNLVCLFVCCIQFLAAVKFLKNPQGYKRTHQFLKNNSTFRVIAIGCFLMSIPIFFTGIILFTFINFDEVPALVTSGFIGIGIVFCGFASVHTVYQWQCEKTKASQEASKSRLSHIDSGLLQPVELSTLV